LSDPTSVGILTHPFFEVSHDTQLRRLVLHQAVQGGFGLGRIGVDGVKLFYNPTLKFNAAVTFLELPFDVGKSPIACLMAHKTE
jgi:hypothetical protein